MFCGMHAYLNNCGVLFTKCFMKMNARHLLLLYEDYVNLLGGNLVKFQKQKVSCMQPNIGQTHYIKITSRYFENVANFIYGNVW
jgi:hypothetical protein